MSEPGDIALGAVPLLSPREGVPPVVTTPGALARTVAAFAAAAGPVAVDAERASGYRYGQRAYLVQLRRAGAGSALIDPIALPNLGELGYALRDAEWVLHAANQDLPCLAEIGLRPIHLFDTELAGRLLGLPRVGLGPLVESVLGLTLEKGHSAADWSTRPLPESWLRYAALDVEVLIELRDALERQLRAQGKLEWAHEEFAALASAEPVAPRVEPWRRTSGLHRVRRRRQLGVVRALWEERDRLARRHDIAPGRVLSDAAIVAAALATPATANELRALAPFAGRGPGRHLQRWAAAVSGVLALPEAALPALSLPHEGPPTARSWGDRDPVAAQRLAALRAAVGSLAETHGLPTENLLSPDTLRRIAWAPPPAGAGAGAPVAEGVPAAEDVATALRTCGARPWQVALNAPVVAATLRQLALAPAGSSASTGGDRMADD